MASPRHRPAHGPAHACRPQPARVTPRPPLLRSRHLPPVHPLPPHRRRPLRLLLRAPRHLPHQRLHLPHLHRPRDAPRHRRPPHRRHPRRRHVQPLRRPQLPRLHHRHRLLPPLATMGKLRVPHALAPETWVGPPPAPTNTTLVSRLSTVFWAVVLFAHRRLRHPARRQGPRRRNRPLHSLRRLRLPPRRLPPRHPHKVRNPNRSHPRHDLRPHPQPALGSAPSIRPTYPPRPYIPCPPPARRLHLVRPHRRSAYLRRRHPLLPHPPQTRPRRTRALLVLLR